MKMRKAAIVLLSLTMVFCLSVLQAGAVKSGGTFNWVAPYGSTVATLDPHHTTENDGLITINIFRSLYRWDGNAGKPMLELADAVDVSKDGLVYTYHLKKNVKFHNGRLMTADDIIYSYERIMDPKVVYGATHFVSIIKGAREKGDGQAEKISGLKKIDDFTLQITLKNPLDPGFMLWTPEVAIVPREEVERTDVNFASNPVGCGPFKFVKWVKGSEVVLEKFQDYYVPGHPYLDKLVYKIMGESATRNIAFKARELDATVISASQYKEFKNNPQLSKNLLEVAEMFTRAFVFNRDYTLPDGRKPLADKRVRQAINYAIDSKLIIDRFQKGKAYPCVGFLPPTSVAFDHNAKGYEYNLEKAKALMKEAGYADGFPLEVLGTANSSYGNPVTEVTIPFLKKINIDVKPLTLEEASKHARQRAGKFQTTIASMDSGPDPLHSLWRFHSSTPRSGRNTPGYNNPEFDRILEEAAKIAGYPPEKIKLLQKADAIFKEDAPIWFFNYNKAIIAYHPWVNGLQPVAVELMYQDFANVWVDETSPRAKK